jgi:hypothetical protein
VSDTVTGDVIYTAKWAPAETTYTVEHYKQNIDGTYSETPSEIETFT